MAQYTVTIETDPVVTVGERERIAEELKAAPALREPSTTLTNAESGRGALRSTFRTESATLPLAISTGISTFELALRLSGVAEDADIVTAHATTTDTDNN